MMADLTYGDIASYLDVIAQLREQIATMCQDIDAQILALQQQRENMIEHQLTQEKESIDIVKAAVLERKQTVQGKKLMAVYAKGELKVDVSLLKFWCNENNHNDILPLLTKQGNASVRINTIK